MSVSLGKPRGEMPPLTEQRLGAILRLFVHIANDPYKPMVANSVYVHDVGDLLAEVARLRAARETGEAESEAGE